MIFENESNHNVLCVIPEPDPKERTEQELFNIPTPIGIKILPKTQQEALTSLAESEYLRENLGAEVIDNFIMMKEFGLNQYHEQITPYEKVMVDEY